MTFSRINILEESLNIISGLSNMMHRTGERKLIDLIKNFCSFEFLFGKKHFMLLDYLWLLCMNCEAHNKYCFSKEDLGVPRSIVALISSFAVVLY